MAKHLIFQNPEGLPKSQGYSHVVQAVDGRTIYISGQVALDRDGQLVGKDDFEAQCVQVFENVRVALESAESDFGSVVKLNFYLTDMQNLPALRIVRDRYVVTSNPPASSAFEVRRLVREDWLIEIDAVAVGEEKR